MTRHITLLIAFILFILMAYSLDRCERVMDHGTVRVVELDRRTAENLMENVRCER